MGMLFYGSLEYFIENGEEDTGFYSIPQGMWYAVQTLTSLGYGDFSPTTLLGKLVGSACAVSGVLVMALPIPIVVDNFGTQFSTTSGLEMQCAGASFRMQLSGFHASKRSFIGDPYAIKNQCRAKNISFQKPAGFLKA